MAIKTSITLDIAIGDQTFLKIAKIAHEKNQTFNQTINGLIMSSIESLSKSQPVIDPPQLTLSNPTHRQ